MVNDAEPRIQFYPENDKPADSDVINNDNDKQRSNSKNGNKKRSPTLAAAIILGVLLVVFMVTLAFFTSFDEVTNVFGGGKLDIILTEPNWKPNEAKNIVPDKVLDKDPYITNNDNTAAYVFLEVTMPCAQIEVEDNNTNKGSAIDGTVGTGVNVPLYKFGILNDNGTPDNQTDDTYSFDTDYKSTDQNVNSGWKLVDFGEGKSNPTVDTTNNVIKYVYAHVQTAYDTKLCPLDKGYRTQYPLFNKIKLVNFDETNTTVTNYSVHVKAYGIQANFLSADNQTTNDPATVWNILNSGS